MVLGFLQPAAMHVEMQNGPPDSTPPLFNDVHFAVIKPPQLPGENPGFTEVRTLTCTLRMYLGPN